MNPQNPIEKVEPIELAKLPNSAKVIWEALEERPATQKDLCKTTGISRRTIYHATKRLKEQDLIEKVVSLKDARQIYLRRKVRVEEAVSETAAPQAVQRKRASPFYDRRLAQPVKRA